MNTLLRFTITSFTGLILASQQVCAADVGEFYLGAQLGSSHVVGDGPKNDLTFTPNQEFKASDSAYALHAGFQFNDWFATELGFTDFGRTSHRFDLRDGVFFLIQPNDTQTLEAKSVALSGVFSYKIASRLSVFGVVGVASVDYEVAQSGGFSPITGSLSIQNSFSDQGLLYGFGATYKLTSSLNLRADLRRIEVEDFNLDLAGIGIEYSF